MIDPHFLAFVLSLTQAQWAKFCADCRRIGPEHAYRAIAASKD